MNFIKVKVKQQVEGKPGFVEEEIIEVQINTENITLFNQGEEDPSVTFVRLTCGATLCVDMKYDKFISLLNKKPAVGAKK